MFKEPQTPQMEIKTILFSSPTRYKNTSSKLRPLRVSNLEIEDDQKKDGCSNYSTNELVNVCYAKMWHGYNSTTGHVFYSCESDETNENRCPNIGEANLDKLQKLKVASKYKTRKKINFEVKKWCESPEAFVSVLQDIKKQKSSKDSKTQNCTDHIYEEKKISNELNKYEDDFEILKESLDCASNIQDESEESLRSQVHFPNHVLISCALRDNDHKEMQKIIKSNVLDLNALIHNSDYYYLHKTILNDQFECAKVLIDNGVNVNEENHDGTTPLALAFRVSNFKMVALLVEAGANIGAYTRNRIKDFESVQLMSSSVSKVFEMEV